MSKVYEQIDQICQLLKLVYSPLSTQKVIDTFKPIYDENENLSDEEIFDKMLTHLSSEKPFGDELAKAAQELKVERSSATHKVYADADLSSILETAKKTFTQETAKKKITHDMEE